MNEGTEGFVRQCERDYTIKMNLKRHRKTCNAQNLMELTTILPHERIAFMRIEDSDWPP